jgi:hypothetical protein
MRDDERRRIFAARRRPAHYVAATHLRVSRRAALTAAFDPTMLAAANRRTPNEDEDRPM